VNSIAKGWAQRWKANRWKRKPGGVVPNWDLWEQLLALTNIHTLRMHWVRGHDGHEENERCDELATAAAADGPDGRGFGVRSTADAALTGLSRIPRRDAVGQTVSFSEC
jgi:ribonuclease HI